MRYYKFEFLRGDAKYDLGGNFIEADRENAEHLFKLFYAGGINEAWGKADEWATANNCFDFRLIQ